jgi:FKBP-type peptidyl-prolyl cis-trans isomerase
MTILFSAAARRFFFFVLLTTTALLSSSCEKDEPDYTKIDDDIIQKYLAENAITTARRQPSGLYYVPTLTDTTKVRATAGRTVKVLYTGMFMDGTVFDASSRQGNVPLSFVLGQGIVIAGWDEGLALMHKGDKGVLLIPSALAYGKTGKGNIPANTVLRFVVELVDVR